MCCMNKNGKMGRCGAFAAGIFSAVQTPGSVKLIQLNGRPLEQHRNTVIDRIHDLAIVGYQGLFERLGQYGAIAVREPAFTDRESGATARVSSGPAWPATGRVTFTVC